MELSIFVSLKRARVFVSLNKDKELEGGPKFMFLFCLWGGGL
jgi:hypothetical protein